MLGVPHVLKRAVDGYQGVHDSGSLWMPGKMRDMVGQLIQGVCHAAQVDGGVSFPEPPLLVIWQAAPRQWSLPVHRCLQQ